jgi:hypothetical protein
MCALKTTYYVGFEVLIAVSMKIAVFFIVVLCSLVEDEIMYCSFLRLLAIHSCRITTLNEKCRKRNYQSKF